MDPEIVDRMILAGVVEVSGVHKYTGELLYSFTSNLEAIEPELANHVNNVFHSTVMSLWQKGFVDGNMEDEDPMITVTQKGFEDKEIESLQPFEKAILENLKVYLYEQ
jgi:hypothetical protein